MGGIEGLASKGSSVEVRSIRAWRFFLRALFGGFRVYGLGIRVVYGGEG